MIRTFAALTVLLGLGSAADAASGREPAPAGAPQGAPAQFTRFTPPELSRGFLALAFGSDLRIGAAPRGIRKFTAPVHVRIISGGSVDRTPAMRAILDDYARQVPSLGLSIVDGASDIEVRLTDEKDFVHALQAAFGMQITKAFVARTDPQCMTSVRSSVGGAIIKSIAFIIVDRGDDVFFDCAYHELLHAFGLSNHDQRNPWTTLNQRRRVGYLTVYDRALLTLLYDRRVAAGLSPEQARQALPALIGDLGLATERPAPRLQPLRQ